MSAPISNQNGTTSALTINTETFLGSDITTVYLIADPTFAVSTMTGYGFIGARRRR